MIYYTMLHYTNILYYTNTILARILILDYTTTILYSY